MSSDEITAACPPIELDVLNSNGSALDSAIFTFTSGTSTFEIESSDIAKLDTYNLKVTAKYTGASYINISELPFTVIVANALNHVTTMIAPFLEPEPQAQTTVYTGAAMELYIGEPTSKYDHEV